MNPGRSAVACIWAESLCGDKGRPGGPGVGGGGNAGQPGENSTALGNLLISAENFVDADGDGLVDDPDDDANGAWFELFFTEETCVFSIDLIDIELGEGPADVFLYDASGGTILHVQPAGLGNNSVQTVELGACGVDHMMIDIYGSGGVDNVVLCPGGDDEVCDGVDNDGDGDIDEGFDADGDGVTSCGGDCDDADANTYPGAPELCDGKDNDCDGALPGDETDDDGDGWTECNGDCDDANPGANPDCPDICNGIDDDCDGSIDEDFDQDGDGQTTCGGDCVDTDPNIYTGAPEFCDNVDTDCDGAADNGFDEDGDGIPDCIDECPMTVDFEEDPWGTPLVAGDDASNAYQNWGMLIEQFDDPNLVVSEPATVVDSGGATGNIMNAEANANSWWIVNFSSSTCVHTIDMLGVAPDELAAQVILFDVNVQTITTIDASGMGDDSVETLDLGGICGVYVMMIDFYADGGWDNLTVCVDPDGTEEVCGDGVDNDGDGGVDEDCPPPEGDPEGDDDDDDDDDPEGNGDDEDGPDCSMAGDRVGSSTLTWLLLALFGTLGVTRRRQ